mgnify:CR=1 FL=1
MQLMLALPTVLSFSAFAVEVVDVVDQVCMEALLNVTLSAGAVMGLRRCSNFMCRIMPSRTARRIATLSRTRL